MRAKRVIGFVLSLAMALACAVELYSALKNLSTHSPQRISLSESQVTKRFEQWFGGGRSRHRETVTIVTINERPAMILGNTSREGWILPAIRPDNYRSEVPGVGASIDVFQMYQVHPYIIYAAGSAICLLLLAVSVFIGIRCIWSDTV